MRALRIVRFALKHRVRAFSVHLFGSLLIAATCAGLVFLVWYPGPLAEASDVGPIVLMLLAVDVTVGPVITFIVFNPRKKELRRDLAVVVALQLAALGYGLHAVFVARPAYVVFAVDRFEVVYANELTADKLVKVLDARFKSAPIWGPRVIAARRPETAEERSEIMFGALVGGDDVPQLPQYYVPLADQRGQIIDRLQPLEHLIEFNGEDVGKVTALLSDMAAHPGGASYLPVRGKARDYTAVLDRQTAQVLRFVALNPWH